MSKSEVDLLKGGVFLTAFGATFIYKGLKALKLRRLVRDIPTSKIDSVAMGSIVEVKGSIVASPSDIVESPLTNLPCACFVWIIDEYTKRGKHSSWKEYKRFSSHNCILINDGGKTNLAIKVSDMKDDTTQMSKSVEFYSTNYDLPLKVQEILKEKKILDTNKKSSFFSFSLTRRFRIREISYISKTNVYVLGSLSPLEGGLKKTLKVKGLETQKRETRFQKFIKRPFIIKQFDENKDGLLDSDEQENLLKSLDPKKRSELEAFDKAEDEKAKVKAIFKKSKRSLRIFDTEEVYLSSYSEERLVGKMGLKSWTQIILGPIAFVGGIALVFMALKS